MIRLPVEPLLEIASRRYRVDWDRGKPVGASAILASVCDVSLRSTHRWRKHGLSIDQADKAAQALGLHPVNIWTEWFELGEDE